VVVVLHQVPERGRWWSSFTRYQKGGGLPSPGTRKGEGVVVLLHQVTKRGEGVVLLHQVTKRDERWRSYSLSTKKGEGRVVLPHKVQETGDLVAFLPHQATDRGDMWY
jgi:hypothetical protein